MKVDHLVTPLIDNEVVPGLAIGLVDGDRTYFLGYGTTSLDKPTRPDADTVFEIGSVTKVFTGTLLADMAARGEVSLDDPVAKYLPPSAKMPACPGARAITLLDLATQTSGLPRLPDNISEGRDSADPYRHYSEERLIAYLDGHALPRAPGTKYEYSNLGLGLLGFVLARRAGLSYEALIHERLCGPLDMTSTGITLSPSMAARWSEGYHENWTWAHPWEMRTLVGAGGLRSSVRDLTRFLRANLLQSPSLPPSLHDTIRLAQTIQRDGPGAGARHMALGWHTWGDTSILWHNGETGGYTSFLSVDREHQRGVVVLCNRAGFDTAALGDHLLTILNGGDAAPMKTTAAIPLPSWVLDQWVGGYRFPSGKTFSILRQGDHLYRQKEKEAPVRLFASSPNTFFLRESPLIRLVFLPGAKGESAKVVTYREGEDTLAEKTGAIP